MTSPAPASHLLPMAPAIVVLGAALLILAGGLFVPKERRALLAWLALAAVLGAAALMGYLWDAPPDPVLKDLFAADRYSSFLSMAGLAAAALALLFSVEYAERAGLPQVEYYALLLFSTAGMMLMASATSLITLFLALEVLSISLYIMVGLNRAEQRSAAAGLKYLLLGAFASAFLLYGMALVYGQAGTMSLAGIRAAAGSLSAQQRPLFLAGLALMIAGLGFKAALVPFHFWAPDVYYGAPPSVTAFMSAGAKIASLAALGRVVLVAFGGAPADWKLLLALLAALTMTVGNLAALRQTNLKRLLAYSGIAQAGYVLVGLAAAGELGTAGALFYLLTYALASAATFGAVIAVARWYGADLKGESIESYAGLVERRPWLAAAVILLLLSLAGLPPLAGFMAKLYVLAAAVREGLTWLAIVGVVNSVIAAYYYLRLVIVIAGGVARPGERTQPEPAGPACPALVLGLALACLATLLLGLWPAPFLEWARAAAAALLGG